jgi:hypothetical protein
VAEAVYEPQSGAGPEGAPYPGWVATPEQRERWDVCHGIASHLSGLMEGGEPDQRFCWVAVRALYNSDVPTGSLEEGEVEEADAGPELTDRDLEVVGASLELPDGLADTPGEDELAARVKKLEDARPADGAPDEEWWAWVERMADALDDLLGPHLDGLEDEIGEGLREALFNQAAHPRNRIGKWTAKLGGLRRTAAEHGSHFRTKLGVTLAAAHLKREVAASHRKGHGLHGKLKHAGTREEHLRVASARLATATGKDEEEVRAALRAHVQRGHAAEERARKGVSGRRQKAIRGGNIAGGATLSSIHRALVADPSATLAREVEGHHDKGAKRVAKGAAGAAGTYEFDPRQAKDIHGVGSTAEDVKTVADKTFDVTRWAHEHADELKAAGHVAKHLAHAAARAKGLAAADDDEDGGAAAFHEDLVHTV